MNFLKLRGKYDLLMSSSCGVRMEMKQSSKWRAILLLCVIAAPVVLGQDFLDYLLSTHDLVEVPELSKTNLGSDNLYIVDHGTEDEPDFDFGMSYQLYKPNKGGPGKQSTPFRIRMMPTWNDDYEDEDVSA